jgi:hypothetical protein
MIAGLQRSPFSKEQSSADTPGKEKGTIKASTMKNNSMATLGLAFSTQLSRRTTHAVQHRRP